MRGNLPHQLTYIGAVLFIAGTFMPLVKLPVIGDISYYRADETSAMIVAVIAALIPLLIMIKRDKFSIIGAAAIWVVLLWPVVKNSVGGDDNNFLDSIVEQAKDPLNRFASEIFSNIDQFSWGGYIFLGGLIVLTIGSFLTTFKGK